MEIIIEKHSLCKNIKPDNGKPLRKNRLIITHTVDDGLLLYNTLTLGLVFLPGITLEDWTEERLSDDTRKQLINELFFVNEDFDEKNTFEQLKSIATFINRRTEPSKYNILTTLACNARCPYCFEAGRNKSSRMDKATAKDVADFIIKRGGNQLKIRWFGGEPLLNTEAIDIISSRLREKGINFATNISTNGYLFNKLNLAEKIKDWNLEAAFITLDGTSEIYRKIKNYYGNPENPFGRVMDNIQSLIDCGVKIGIRFNVSKENIDNMFELADFLKNKFDCSENVKLWPVTLYQYQQRETTPDDLEFFDRFQQLCDSIRKNKPQQSLPRIWKTHRCGAELDDELVINPDGTISKCTTCADGVTVGDIHQGIDPKLDAVFHKIMVVDHCRECNLLAVCKNMEACPTLGGICNEFTRKSREYKLRQKMANEYNFRKENAGSKIQANT